MRLNAPRAVTVAAAVLAAVIPLMAAAQAVNPNAGIEERVHVLFADAPLMISVAKCESGFRQFAPDGSVLRGGAGKGYLGVFQIGERLHTGTAAGLGFDILTTDGNLGYARHMFDRQGATPWRDCLPADGGASAAPGPAPVATSAPALPGDAPASVTPRQLPTASLTANLSNGSRGEQVRLLQQKLNALGHVVAATGPGSPGNETVLFGALTREAVRRFQCAKGIACEGSEWTTGYGRVGPKTRAALNQP